MVPLKLPLEVRISPSGSIWSRGVLNGQNVKGNALKFYSSVRLDIRKKEVIKDNQGITARIKVSAYSAIAFFICICNCDACG